MQTYSIAGGRGYTNGDGFNLLVPDSVKGECTLYVPKNVTTFKPGTHHAALHHEAIHSVLRILELNVYESLPAFFETL